jgi:hypothetical protein
VGSVQVALNPLPFATTTLSTQTGSVFATLTKYEGMFMASTRIGSVKVTGNDVVIDKRTGRLGQDVEGHVGNGNCLLNAKTKVGSVHLDFE